MKIIDEAEKLMNERKDRANRREWIQVSTLNDVLGPQDEAGYFVEQLRTEDKSQPRGDFRVACADGSVVWVEVKTVNQNRFDYLDDFFIPAPTDWRKPSGWTDNDRFLIIVSVGQTGQTRYVWLNEPWERPLKRFRAWGTSAGWNRLCFVLNLSDSPETVVQFSEDLKTTFAKDSETRMWGGW